MRSLTSNDVVSGDEVTQQGPFFKVDLLRDPLLERGAHRLPVQP